ncbi:unnamed protein product [Prunus armeniaca]
MPHDPSPPHHMPILPSTEQELVQHNDHATDEPDISSTEVSRLSNVPTHPTVTRSRRADGSIERYKARLVANGFHQKQGVDYSETFSPMVKHSTIHLVLSLVVTNKWSVRQLDVQNAFLHGYLSEEVYMKQPVGFVDPQFPNHVCRLQRSLYGLKQAPQAWFDKFSYYLLQLGFQESKFTYVGDSMHLTQSKYTLDLLQCTKFLDAKPISTPVSSGQKLSAYDGKPHANPETYRSIVGALQYLTITRPDLSYAVNQVSQFIHSLKTPHWLAVKCILCYLKSSYDCGIVYKPGSLQVSAFSNADYAGDPDSRHSTGGYCVYVGTNLVSWSSKKHKTVSRSSIEVEYRQLACPYPDPLFGVITSPRWLLLLISCFTFAPNILRWTIIMLGKQSFECMEENERENGSEDEAEREYERGR